MKKSGIVKLGAVALTAVLAVSLVACGKGGASAGEITVVSREDGSGTRGAFVELFGIEEKDESGNKIDKTTEEAVTTNSTSVMMTTVAGDESAIGYISLGSLNSTVKALKIGGVAPSVATVKDGTYKISRPFNIVTKDGISPVAQDFIAYILSSEGQAVVEANGYIKDDKAQAFTGTKPSGKIVVAGSSSVNPVMEKLKEEYVKINAGADIEIQANDSTTGVSATVDGICDIGMVSRELKDTEIAKGLKSTVIAQDGIAVIVNTDGPVDDLSPDQVKSIFNGTVTTWADFE